MAKKYDKEPVGWFTVNGKHIPIFDEDTSEVDISDNQREWEDSIRDGKVEKCGFFDKDGNLLMEVEGNEDAISFGGENDWDNSIKFNREVEQRIWRDEEINSTHNHPENTIFSPEDIEGFEELENHSERAVLPNGINYTIIREQPRTSNEWEYNESTGELERKFEPKKIGPAYREAYSKIYNNEALVEIRRKTEYGSPERQKMVEELDKKVATEMEKWLTKNAKSYGYRFVKEQK